MADLFLLLSPEDKGKMEQWSAKQKENKYKQDIPQRLYIAAQLGYYYGWPAVVDFRRGYHEAIDNEGNRTQLAFTLDEAIAFIKAAEKVHYRQMVDQSRTIAATQVSSNDQTYADRNADYVNEVVGKKAQ